MGPASISVTWLSQLLLWVIFADNVGFREILVGALAAAVSTYFVWLYLSETSDRFTLKVSCLGQIMHVPEIVMTGSWVLLRATARKLSGKKVPSGIVAVRFHAGGKDETSKGRRALAITYLTCAPNNLVLGILKERNLYFFHTVIPQPLPSFMFKMGAELDDDS